MKLRITGFASWRVFTTLTLLLWSGQLRIIGKRTKLSGCEGAFIPCTKIIYLLLTITSPKNSKWGWQIIIQSKKSTASPFVGTFPATNLLVKAVFTIKVRMQGFAWHSHQWCVRTLIFSCGGIINVHTFLY